MEQRKQGRRSDGRFLGFWARLNCEEMPVIPAWLVRLNFKDPRRIPYLLVWKRESDGKVMEAVRLVCCSAGPFVELKRSDGSKTILRLVSKTMPRDGGQDLLVLCPYCDTPRRFVYGWEWDSFSGWSNRVRQVSWCCRSCNRLRYSSEGGHLRQAGRGTIAALFRCLGTLPRPQSWLPYVFTSIDDPRLNGMLAKESVLVVSHTPRKSSERETPKV